MDLFKNDPTIVYSVVGTVQDMRELVDLAAAGRVTSHVSRVGALSELGTILGELERAEYLGPRRDHRSDPIDGMCFEMKRISSFMDPGTSRSVRSHAASRCSSTCSGVMAP